MPGLQKTKFGHLTTMQVNVMQMKSEHFIHMKAKSERLIYKRRSPNISVMVLTKVMQMKSKHLIHMKAKSEGLIYRRQSLNV